MPCVDMMMNDLERYLGKSPKPIGFDEYWRSQVEIVNSKELKYQVVPHEFNNSFAQYYDIYFEGVDGAKIHGKYVRPNVKHKVPVVFQFHDYGLASRSWFQMTRYPGIGYAVATMDARGQGGLSEDVGGVHGPTVVGHVIQGTEDTVDDMYYRKIYLDAYILTRIVAELDGIDADKMITFGDGQGGGIALVTAALNQQIKKCISLNPMLSDYYRILEMDCDQGPYEGIRYHFRWKDQLHLYEKEFFEKLGYIDVQNFADKVEAEILMGTSLLDRVCPPSTQYAIYNKVNSKKEHVVFPKFEHEPVFLFETIYLKFLKFQEIR